MGTGTPPNIDQDPASFDALYDELLVATKADRVTQPASAAATKPIAARGNLIDDLVRELSKRCGLLWLSVFCTGAIGDGSTDDTDAIQEAIDTVDYWGGGEVRFPPPPGGSYVHGSLTLRTGVRLDYTGLGTPEGSIHATAGDLYHRTDGAVPVYVKTGGAGTSGWVAFGGSGGDADAFHKSVAAEISALALKATPAAADHVLIEDSAAADIKKRTPVSAMSPEPDVQTFASTGTWTKPANARTGSITRVIAIGGGGGGQSGDRDVASYDDGGNGGDGGSAVIVEFLTSALGATEAVTVGAGGAGGAAVTGAAEGNPGVSGGDSGFGTSFALVKALGGEGGDQTTGSQQLDTWIIYAQTHPGGRGGEAGPVATCVPGERSAAAGGGGAGGAGQEGASSNPGLDGGAGGPISGAQGVSTNYSVETGGGGAGGAAEGGAGTAGASATGHHGGDGGGGGGGFEHNGDGGAGGAGGLPGGGGGGGGGLDDTDSNESGTGGLGGTGRVWVLTWI